MRFFRDLGRSLKAMWEGIKDRINLGGARHSGLVIISVLAAFPLLNAQERPAADLILTNAKVWTVDLARPRAEALAVIGDRIVAVGSASDIDAWRGTKTTVIDAGGKLVLPGFDDAHVHFTSGGFQLDSVNLKEAASPQEFAEMFVDQNVMGGD